MISLQERWKQQKANQFLIDVSFSSAKNEDELGYKDPFVTSEQKKRDAKITELLGEYVGSYRGKVRHSTVCRYIILIPCMIIICGFAGILAWFSACIVKNDSVSIEGIVAFVTACISFITLIIGLLQIITKYFFPENDEQYITKIVESIQRNDLENKRENAKNGQKSATKQRDSEEEHEG